MLAEEISSNDIAFEDREKGSKGSKVGMGTTPIDIDAINEL